MNQINGCEPEALFSLEAIKEGAELEFSCCVHKIKKRSGFTFVTLRTGRYTLLAVHNPKYCEKPLKNVFEGVYIHVKCIVRHEIKAENGLEIAITDYDIISKPHEKYTMPVSDRVLDLSPEEIAEGRCLSLRNPMERAPMLVFGALVDSFCEFMKKNGFVYVRTPLLTQLQMTEDKDSFITDYFGEKAYLCSDSSVYLQQSLAYFDRVYDVSKVFFGKKRNSPRLLNEYTSLQFQMSYISGISQLMEIVVSMLKYMVEYISGHCAYELDLLQTKLPDNWTIPELSFQEVMDILGKTEPQQDLDPTDEKRICAWAKENTGCEFVFVSALPSSKRPPYYAEEKGISKSFVLLFRGIEIASGGERINDYCRQVDKLKGNQGFDSYTDYHKYGLANHGGAGIGMERFVMQLLGLKNVREASVFPRDIHILRP